MNSNDVIQPKQRNLHRIGQIVNGGLRLRSRGDHRPRRRDPLWTGNRRYLTKEFTKAQHALVEARLNHNRREAARRVKSSIGTGPIRSGPPRLVGPRETADHEPGVSLPEFRLTGRRETALALALVTFSLADTV